MKKSVLNNQRGVSLVEVMVAAGISSVIALGTMKINENSQRAMREVSTKADLNNFLNNRISGALAKNENCMDAWDFDGDGTAESSIVIAEGDEEKYAQILDATTGNVIAATGELIANDGEYRVGRISIARNGSSCNLNILLEREDGTGVNTRRLGARVKTETLPFTCSWDTSTDEMTSCSTVGAAGNGHWNLITEGVDKWLENPYGYALLGTYTGAPGTSPVTPLTINPGTPVQWTAHSFKGENIHEGAALPNNYIMRWGDINASDSGVGIFGNSNVNGIVFAEPTAGPYFLSTPDGTELMSGYFLVQNDYLRVDNGMFLASGTSDGTASPPSGAGTRFLWLPSKGAFFGGRTTDAGWSTTFRMGNYSFAFGDTVRAFGIGSVAMGTRAIANGLGGIAIGQDANASSSGSIALGTNSSSGANQAVAIGGGNAANLWSIAIGANAEATSNSSVAIGYGAKASGGVALAGGEASGGNAFAVGSGSVASGNSSFAAGGGSTASALYSVAIGASNTASGSNTFASGEGTTASGDSSAVFGKFGVASGRGAFVTGDAPLVTDQNTASGTNSAVIGGDNNTASNTGAIVLGGTGSTASGESSVVSGSNNQVHRLNSFIAGGRNNSIDSSGAGANHGIFGGSFNTISSAGGNSVNTILGGASNTIGPSGAGSTILGGTSNSNNAAGSTIIGRECSTSGTYSIAMGYRATAAHTYSVVIGSDYIASDTTKQFKARFDNGYKFCTNDTCSQGIRIASDGTATVNGVAITSDRNKKEDFEDIVEEEFLDSLSELELSSWVYKDQKDKSKRRVGPMAQDFYRLFSQKWSLGSSEKEISMNDIDGVLLASVKALEKRTRDLKEQNDELKDKNEKLQKRLEKIEAALGLNK